MRNGIFRLPKGLVCGLVVWSAVMQAASLPTAAAGTGLQENICYAQINGQELLLDLYRPAEVNEPLPLIVWIHGGAWQAGDKKFFPIRGLEQDGFAIASINYRFTDQAIFPAQIHDCKAAIRFLRANAGRFGIDPNSIGAAGDSAGGHLAALVGTSGGVRELEGRVGGNLEYSSTVRAVCDWYGPTDFLAFADPDQFDPQRHPVVEKLFGGPVTQKKQLARAASPISHVDPKDPPFLIMHGDKDNVVPLDQSIRFYEKLKKAGVPAELIVVEGAGHGFPNKQQIEQLRDFFVKHLKKEKAK
jgi:acetyl esterase/lipase